MARGGRRPGSGKPKGYKHQKTLEKEAALTMMRQMVIAELGPMVNAQLEHAKGVGYMLLRRPDGTFARATDAKQIDAACAALGPDVAKMIFTQAPNVQAFTALTDRTFGKPPERVELTGSEGQPLEIVIKKPWAEK